jgi:hypothetical protein
MNSQAQYTQLLKGLMSFVLFASLLFLNVEAIAQERPPRPIAVKVDLLQQLNFGSIIPTGTYGSVTVTYDRLRTSEGHVLLMGLNFSPALFSIDAERGTLITIVNGPPVNLSSSNGRTVRLELGEASTGYKFVTTSQFTDVSIGGKLIIGSILDNPGGFYSGSFQVTFIQE